MIMLEALWAICHFVLCSVYTHNQLFQALIDFFFNSRVFKVKLIEMVITAIRGCIYDTTWR